VGREKEQELQLPKELPKEPEKKKRPPRTRNKKKKDKDSSKQTLLNVFTRTLTTTSSMSRKQREELKRSKTVDMADEEDEEREEDLNVGGVDVTRSSTLMTAPSVVYGTPKRSKSKKKKTKGSHGADPQLLSGLGGDRSPGPRGSGSPGLVVAPLEFPMGRGFNAPPSGGLAPAELARQRLEKSKKTK
jgi:hypothetical protein